MTIIVDGVFQDVSVNSTDIPETGQFILTSGWSKEPVSLNFTRISQNTRYSTIEVEFPIEFKNEHKNGVYYYSIEGLERGYVKIITEPGGSINTVAYNSGVVTENRESKVYYRPQY